MLWTVVLEKTLESPLDSKEIKQVNPKGNDSWVFIGRTDAKAEATILWPPDMKNWLTGKDPDAGKDWRQEEGMTEDKMVACHHQLDGHEFEQALGDGEGQESLAGCSPQGHKELDTTEWLNSNNNSVLFSQRWRSSTQSAKTRPGAECSWDRDLLIAKFRLKLKKLGETSRSFRYGLNQIPYMLEVTNKFKGLDLVDRAPKELWTEVCNIIHNAVTKIIPNRKKCKKAKWLSEEVLQNSWEEKWKAREKGKDIFNGKQSSRGQEREKEGLLQWTVQRNRGKQ